MYLIRDIMYCKPGKVRPMVDKFLAMNALGVKVGMPPMKIMTDFRIVGMKRRLGLHGNVVAESPHTYQRAHRSRTGRTLGGQPPWIS